jgi:hypothetical protein
MASPRVNCFSWIRIRPQLLQFARPPSSAPPPLLRTLVIGLYRQHSKFGTLAKSHHLRLKLFLPPSEPVATRRNSSQKVSRDPAVLPVRYTASSAPLQDSSTDAPAGADRGVCPEASPNEGAMATRNSSPPAMHETGRESRRRGRSRSWRMSESVSRISTCTPLSLRHGSTVASVWPDLGHASPTSLPSDRPCPTVSSKPGESLRLARSRQRFAEPSRCQDHLGTRKAQTANCGSPYRHPETSSCVEFSV